MTVKLFLENPYIKQIKANVVDIKHEDDKCTVELDKTLFYPHMCGGQPRDKGSIDNVKVIDVIKENEKIIHILDKSIYNKEVSLSIDWQTRFDHMQQHTGQHILSACFKKLYNVDTVGFHLGSTYTYIDVTMHNISAQVIKKIEKLANEVIYSNLPVKNFVVQKDMLKDIPIRKEPIVDKDIRIIEIESIDCTPCAGTHVKNTGEVGIIKIRKWENYKGNTRIEFACGQRALLDYDNKNTQINNISNLLSVKDTECQQGVENILRNMNEYNKQIITLKKEIAVYNKQALLSAKQAYNNVNIIKHIFNDEDINFNVLRKISHDIISNNENYVIIVAIKSTHKCQLIIATSENISLSAKDIFSSVISIIDGKGGGNNTLAQGGGTKVDNLSHCLYMAESMIKEIL
ncbi:DHHA1 domain-containing protein [Clostridiaceae bacterium M8S5]|nr:DHHA1 domain-containing protein [Clostridiaceae bacterium M8S5]